MRWIIKSSLTFLMTLTTLLFCLASISLAEPDDIFLDHQGAFHGKQRPGVHFKHALHIEGLECLDCHHRYEKGKNVLDEGELEENAPNVKCISCHKDSDSISPKNAFHRQCMGCHMSIRKQGRHSGPELCGECHK
jgi:hypothetical protein